MSVCKFRRQELMNIQHHATFNVAGSAMVQVGGRWALFSIVRIRRVNIRATLLMDIPGVLAEHKVLPILADCTLAPFLSSCCGIGSIVIS
jgi:hypothetical protein